MIIFDVKDLCKQFASGRASQNTEPIIALDKVSLQIEQGDIFGIIGVSGAGKSTLLRCFSMLEQPTSGSILLDGVDLTKLKGQNKRAAHHKMGVIFQGYNLLAQSTVAQNVAFPLKLKKHKNQAVQARVNELLQLVGLNDKANAYPAALSGGQKQRVAIARALANNPEILLCDEPTSALDYLTTQQILHLLKDINAKLGVTIVIISHEIAVVKAICTKTAVLDKAKLIEIGLTKQVLSQPKNAKTKALLSIA